MSAKLIIPGYCVLTDLIFSCVFCIKAVNNNRYDNQYDNRYDSINFFVFNLLLMKKMVKTCHSNGQEKMFEEPVRKMSNFLKS